MTSIEILQAAKKRIEKPECWTQGYYARMADGGHAEPAGCMACSWCSLGALKSLSLEGRMFLTQEYWAAKAALSKAMGDCIPYFNDHHNHAEVLDAFDRAIVELGKPNKKMGGGKSEVKSR